MTSAGLFNLKLLLKFVAIVVALGSLWIICMGQPKSRWESSYSLTNEVNGSECNCLEVIRGNVDEISKAKSLVLRGDFRKQFLVTNDFYIDATKDCNKFKADRKYFQSPLSQEEVEFPLAYSMVVHHKVQNFERLLRAIYAPQNVYCVHVDTKSASSFQAAVAGIVSCFPNVFLVSRPVSVIYAEWSRVQADLNCMADLYNSSTKWKYFINLCGQDFPLKTNLEIVRMLKSLWGSNSMESEKMPQRKLHRVKYVHRLVDGVIKKTDKKKHHPPFDIPILSGKAYIVVNRGYIHSVLTDSRIHKLMEWGKDTYSPDEFLWASIQRLPDVPGSQWPHRVYDTSELTAIARLVKWIELEGEQGSHHAAYTRCQGHHVREVCVFGVGDLTWLVQQHHLFANKFDVDNDAIAVLCLEKYLRQRALAMTD